MSGSQTIEISLIEVWKEVFRNKIAIVLSSALFCGVAVYIAISLPNKYTAKALLVPISDESSGLSSLAKSLGGLAGVAGLRLGKSRGPDKTDIALEVLKSQGFINDFVNRHNLLVPLMASTGSNKITQELILDPEVYDINEDKWLRVVKPPKTVEPSPEEVYEAFLNIIEVERIPKSGFVMISVEFFSPSISAQWLELLISDINDSIKQSDKEEAQKSIVFLESIIASTQVAEMKETFYQLIEEQTKTLMLTESRSQYILKTISPISIPEKKSGPKRVLIVIAGIIVGGFLAVLFVLVRFFVKKG